MNQTSQAIKKLILQFEPVKETYIWDKATAIAIVSKYDRLERACKWSQIEAHCEDSCSCEVCKAVNFDPISNDQ